MSEYGPLWKAPNKAALKRRHWARNADLQKSEASQEGLPLPPGPAVHRLCTEPGGGGQLSPVRPVRKASVIASVQA